MVGDGVEREIKIPVDDLDELRQRLIELEAERSSPLAFEDNWLWDRGEELASHGCILRLRQDRLGARLTFKGKAAFEGATKVRREHETRVQDHEALQGILEALGYRPVYRYQKRREEWQLGGITIALDHTPIGDYAEFEGAGAEKVAQRCGLDPSGAEPRSYPEIYADHRREHPDAPRDMVFP